MVVSKMMTRSFEDEVCVGVVFIVVLFRFGAFSGVNFETPERRTRG